MGILLEQLDQKKVAVELPIANEVRVLRGVGDYVNDLQLGKCLRIFSDDPQNTFEILLRVSEWSGPIVPDDRHGCDYRLCLKSACHCS